MKVCAFPALLERPNDRAALDAAGAIRLHSRRCGRGR
jgi:hypothetical protein